MLSGWSVTIHWEASFWSVWEQISLFICDAEEQMGFHQLPWKKQLLRLIMCRCVARYTCLSLSELEITGVSLAQRRIINLLHFSTKPHACSFTHTCWADELWVCEQILIWLKLIMGFDSNMSVYLWSVKEGFVWKREFGLHFVLSQS